MEQEKKNQETATTINQNQEDQKPEPKHKIGKKILFCFVILIGVIFTTWYVYEMKNGMPRQLAVAEYVLRQRMKVPSSLKIEKAYFSIRNGHPQITIEYTANNSYNAPISNAAIFTYQCPSIETKDPNSEATKLRNRLIREDIEKISKGEKIISPFDLCGSPIIEIGNNQDMIDESINSANYSIENLRIKDKNFPPRSSIGGVVTELNEDGTIKADFLIKTFTPGQLFPWE